MIIYLLLIYSYKRIVKYALISTKHCSVITYFFPLSYGVFTLHGTGARTGTGNRIGTIGDNGSRFLSLSLYISV